MPAGGHQVNVEVVNATAEVTVLGPASVVVQQANTEVEVAVGGAQGPQGPAGATGATGPQGPSGVIAVTAPITNSGTSTSANIGVTVGTTAASVASGDRGLPAGGTTAQVLAKTSATDYAVGWSTLALGKVLQVVNAIETSQISTSSTSFVDAGALTATITPSSTSSKVIVVVSLGLIGINNNTQNILLNLVRDSTPLQQPPGSPTRPATFGQLTASPAAAEASTYTLVDSPASTSALTYKLQWRVTGNAAFINRQPGSAADHTTSSITLIEVGP
jgi:hypothetical protein